MTSEDPKLFATYRVLAAEHSSAAADHVADLIEQLRGIIADGVTNGDFTARDPAVTARAVFEPPPATTTPRTPPSGRLPGSRRSRGRACLGQLRQQPAT
ncbi:hypothetical protein J7E91_21310 [Streptomyces sp. ISL-99]|uniref:hypothetical protein n=1 Tax=Streptomyces sp. ISL-99 TaxID=2819193 RepID=UPI001BE5B514|nr:hypothetical protein [Streptomyces sp. ISL-99]MBT2527889.1 hypothetical protein [Streptomyces sp. ISL-99]